MEITQKSTWPKKPTGVIDWEAVFEHPEVGLISLISDARSIHTLRESTIFVIKHLYARKDDPEHVKSFVSELKVLLPDEAPEETLPKITKSVIVILRQIKNERIQKAEEYVQQQTHASTDVTEAAHDNVSQEADNPLAPRPSIERRKAAEHKPPIIKQTSKNPPLVTYLKVLVGAVIAITIAFLVINNVMEEKVQEPAVIFIDQMKAVAAGEEVNVHIYGGALSSGQKDGNRFVLAEGVPGEKCQGAAWVLLNKGGIVINGVYPRQISPMILKDLCHSSGAKASLLWYPKGSAK